MSRDNGMNTTSVGGPVVRWNGNMRINRDWHLPDKQAPLMQPITLSSLCQFVHRFTSPRGFFCNGLTPLPPYAATTISTFKVRSDDRTKTLARDHRFFHKTIDGMILITNRSIRKKRSLNILAPSHRSKRSTRLDFVALHRVSLRYSNQRWVCRKDFSIAQNTPSWPHLNTNCNQI